MVNLRHDQTTMCRRILSSYGDQFLDNRPKLFRFRLGRGDALMQNHRDCKLAQKRLSLRGIATKFPSRLLVPHGYSSPSSPSAGRSSPRKEAIASATSWSASSSPSPAIADASSS